MTDVLGVFIMCVTRVAERDCVSLLSRSFGRIDGLLDGLLDAADAQIM
jgi:hypothetical protein